MDTTITSIHDLAAVVRGRRQRLRLSQAELASRAEVSRAWLNAFEAGKPTVELALAMRLLDALGLRLRISDTDRASDDPPGSAAGIDLDALLDDYREV